MYFCRWCDACASRVVHVERPRGQANVGGVRFRSCSCNSILSFSNLGAVNVCAVSILSCG